MHENLGTLRRTVPLRVASAHRSPKFVEQIVGDAIDDGCSVFIAMAGLAAALPGAVAALTTKPVIGVSCGGRVPYDSFFPSLNFPRASRRRPLVLTEATTPATLRRRCWRSPMPSTLLLLSKTSSTKSTVERPKTRKSTAVPEMFDAEEFIAESIESLKATIDDVAIIAVPAGLIQPLPP